MFEYTRIEPPMEIIYAGDNVSCGATRGILLLVVRGTDDVLRKVKLSIVLKPELNIFLVRQQLKKVSVIALNGSPLDLGPFCIQLIRFDNR